ncbi:MAG TPA: amidohydrolase [Enterobacteriaceae bacterium]|nr:amidohydrolase [Enterobacteriaceae bacterium]
MGRLIVPGFKITLLQQPLVWMDGPANLRHFDRQLETIIGRDVIVLPEMFTTGFAMQAAQQSLPQSEVIAWMQAKAQQTNALVAGSAALQSERGPVNRFLLVEPEGKVHSYDKRHLFRMAGEHEHYSPGERQAVFAVKGWRVRPLICYDLRFPVWSRDGEGTDLLLYTANWPGARRMHWNRLLPARAIENLCYVAAVNRVGTDGKGFAYTGDSQLLDFQGETLLCAGEADGVFHASLDAQALQAYRSKFPAHLDADEYELR